MRDPMRKVVEEEASRAQGMPLPTSCAVPLLQARAQILLKPSAAPSTKSPARGA